MSKNFVYFHNTEEHINKCAIGYMVNPILYVNKLFKEQVENCMNDTFLTTTQPDIKCYVKNKLCFSINFSKSTCFKLSEICCLLPVRGNCWLEVFTIIYSK